MKIENYFIPSVPSDIPHGDMPGDVIQIKDEHINKASTIFPLLVEEINKLNKDKIVISIFGGSGVGKSEIASVISYYLNQNNVSTYIMSGDNYPFRIPSVNDAERLSTFRNAGLKALKDSNQYSSEIKNILDKLCADEVDSDPKEVLNHSFLKVYQDAGRNALKGYLGTPIEQEYKLVNEIITSFKNNEEFVTFKRMGRKEEERYYNKVDTRNINVLILEWTHGGNENLQGVDIPILLNSTPEETKAHRLSRARDGKVDSSFTTMVLEIEQEELDDRRKIAKIIISKSGEILDK